MKNKRKIIILIAMTLLLAQLPIVFAQVAEIEKDEPIVFFEPGPPMESTHYFDGSTHVYETERVYTPMIGSDLSDLTLDEFKSYMKKAEKSFNENPTRIQVSGTPQKTGGPNLVFNADGSVPGGALTALDDLGTYFENLFDDTVTVNININFENLGGSMLGGTVVTNINNVLWTTTRNGLVSDMDYDDQLQSWLPGNSIPVRYNADSSSVTNENRCYFSKANYGAAIGTISGTCADISFNNQVSWDYDPSDGVGGNYCFQTVAAHEIGHVFGFVSRAEYWYEPNSNIYCLDIFRFQGSDGTGDYNPDTLNEFQTTPRLVDFNNPNNDHISDLIDVEYNMEDGDPYQASHFDTSVYAIMDPTTSAGSTYYPEFYKTADINMFDAIGWDYSVYSPNTMLINEYEEYQGTENLVIPVEGTWDRTISGYQIGIHYDPTAIEILNVSDVGTVAEGKALFFVYDIPTPGTLSIGVVLNFGQYIPSGEGTLAKIEINVLEEAPVGDSPLDLGNFGGLPPVICAYSDENSVVFDPALVDGKITILELPDGYMTIDEYTVAKGATGVIIPIDGIWEKTISGYQIGLHYDPDTITLTDVIETGTVAEGKTLFFVNNIIEPGNMTIGVVLEFGEYIPAGSGIIANLVVDVDENAELGETILDLGQFGGNPEVICTYSDDISQLFYPGLTDGVLIVSDVQCGDLNGDGGINIADLTFLVAYLFSGGPAPDPECIADLNGDDSVNIADLTYLVAYLFGGGPEPDPGCCS